jgi:prepilin-type N-terminal cleavage/methylation domain-containing protein/prepilin-type processing-associated H-X9-DG protein
MHYLRQRQAFTLIELLVVISIIAILAAMMFSLNKGISETRKNTQRIADLKQIGAALAAYAAENENKYPIAGKAIRYGATDDDGTGLPSWQEQLDSYVGRNRKLFAGPQPVSIGGDQYRNAYFLGSRGANSGSGTADFEAVASLKIESPAKYVLAGYDAVGDFDESDADKDNYTQDPAFNDSKTPGSKKVPLLFADGHVNTFTHFDPGQMQYSYSDPTEGR